MTDMFSIPFEYKNQSYTALVATKENPLSKEYRITIMNGELEQLLYGYHIFSSSNGKIFQENVSEDVTITELQNILILSLAAMESSVASL